MRVRMLFSIVLLIACTAAASDIYVLQGRAAGAPAGECKTYRWDSDVLLFNRGDVPATVRLLSISNGGATRPVVDAFSIGPHQSTTFALQKTAWESSNGSALWVVRFDAPDAVTVEARIAIGYNTPCIVGIPSLGEGAFGKLSFPVYRSLQPAGVPKVILGTDDAAVPSRVNVALYNAATTSASAHIELRQMCDDRPISMRDVAVPAEAVQQVGGFVNTTQCSANTEHNDATYVIVTADQPTLTWVSVLPNIGEIRATYVMPVSSP